MHFAFGLPLVGLYLCQKTKGESLQGKSINHDFTDCPGYERCKNDLLCISSSVMLVWLTSCIYCSCIFNCFEIRSK